MLNEKAVLARLEIGGFTGRRSSRDLARETATAHNAAADTLTTTLRVVPPAELRRIEGCSRGCREYFDSRTLPWEKRGASILPVAIYWDFMERMSKLMTARDEAVNDFCATYEANIDSWVARLNGMAGGVNVPDVSSVRDAFKADLRITPVPSGSDFRVDLGAEETARIRAAADEAAAERVEAGVKDAVYRLREVVERYRDNLRPRVGANGEERRGKVTQALGRDLADLLKVLPAFNLTNDPNIAEILADVATSLPVDTAAVGESDTERERVSAEAARIVEQMRGIWG